MIRTETKTICDRCARPIPNPETATALRLDALGESIAWEHVCESCAGVCRDLLRQIGRLPRLRHRPPKADAPTPAEPRRRGRPAKSIPTSAEAE